MNKAQILATPLSQLGFSTVSLSVISGYFFTEAGRTGQERLESIEKKMGRPFTVADAINARGNNPCPGVKAFNRLKAKLLELGLTPNDWPLLAKDKKGVHRAIIELARGDKEKILALPVRFFIPIQTVLENLACFAEIDNEDHRAYQRVTIGDIIGSNAIWYYPCYKGNTRSFLNLRRSLLSLGLTIEDGKFFDDWGRQEIEDRKKENDRRFALAEIMKETHVSLEEAYRWLYFFKRKNFRYLKR